LLISDEYLALQRELHSRGGYGVSAPKWASVVHDLAIRAECRTVLDYGCGQGLLSHHLPPERKREYRVTEYDPAIEGKNALPRYADLIFCGDVLEHIEPDFLDSVLLHLAILAKKMAFLVIATRPAAKFLADGRNAHLIVEPASWWLPKLQSRWNTKGFMGTADEFQFLGVANECFTAIHRL